MAAKRARESDWPALNMTEAFDAVKREIQVCPTIVKPTLASLGFVLAEDIRALEPFPPFRASIMDGYAVVASDGPGVYPVVEPITAGASTATQLKPGQIMRITTGAQLPVGATAVVMVEMTSLVQATGDGIEEVLVKINKGVTDGENVREIGSDISQDELVLPQKAYLGSSEIGLLASIGVREVSVFRKPISAVISTGDELVDFQDTPTAPKIRDSNRPAILSALEAEGFSWTDLGIVNDSAANLEASIRRGLETADVLITSGGVSMGETDLLKPVLLSLGCNVHFGRVYMKPGKPTTFATATINGKKKLVFALPGNPVSSMVTFYLFVLPTLREMAGWVNPALPVLPVEIQETIMLDPRPEYQRSVVRPKVKAAPVPTQTTSGCSLVAETTGRQISSRLLSMRTANALLVLPPKTNELKELPAGTIVNAILIGSL